MNSEKKKMNSESDFFFSEKDFPESKKEIKFLETGKIYRYSNLRNSRHVPSQIAKQFWFNHSPTLM